MSLRALAEITPLLLAVLMAWWLRGIPPGAWAVPTRILRRFARTERQAILWSAVFSFAVGPIFCWVRPPHPTVHDEFSYLLASDTFAHGRLTNPSPVPWEPFESFHINVRPTYQSKYPPGQGLFLAAGQVLTGRPIVGVWLSMAAGGAAVCWMLLAWMPPRWALFGALLPALRFGSLPLWDNFWFGYWNTTFWGGAVAMAGGALLFGALPRLLREARARDAIVFAGGLMVLANTRPYEGLVAALTAGAVLAGWIVTRRPAWRILTARVVAPAAGVLLASALAMGYYNFRGTGDPRKMPYLAHTEQYEVAPLFIFQSKGPDKTYNHAVLREFQYGLMMEGYNRKRNSLGLTGEDLSLPLDFFWGYALWPPLLWLLGRPWNRWAGFALAVIVVSVLANTLSSSEKLHPHYLAPAAPMFVFLAVAGLRRARAFRFQGRPVGRALAETTVAICLLGFALACLLRGLYIDPDLTELSRYRPRITKQLEESPGMDLVIVRYSPEHNLLQEWVYNGADLAGAPIVWARDMGPEKNQRLLDHYPDRRVWMLRPDNDPPALEPYTAR